MPQNSAKLTSIWVNWSVVRAPAFGGFEKVRLTVPSAAGWVGANVTIRFEPYHWGWNAAWMRSAYPLLMPGRGELLFTEAALLLPSTLSSGATSWAGSALRRANIFLPSLAKVRAAADISRSLSAGPTA